MLGRPVQRQKWSVDFCCRGLGGGGAAGGGLNGGNEVAVGELVQASGKEPMRIGRIFETVEETLSRVGNLPAASLEQVMEADRLARDTARQVLHKLG